MLDEFPGTIELIDRKSYLQTIKKILSNFANNMNNQIPRAKPIRLIDYVKNAVADLMLRADNEMKKVSPSYMMYSSESESETAANLNRIEVYKEVIDDYIGIGAKTSSWHRAFIQARDINNLNFVHNL